MPRQRPQLPSWTLTVADAFDITPNMRRVLFSTDRFADFTYKPGQDIVFFLPLENGETGRRHYTIRSIDRDAGTIAVDFVMHGNTPGPNFARQAKAGDTVEVKGPRGRVVFNPEADWHLLTGDETCIPGILHILETLPQGARA
ncbi:siderophore-interacting protein, partial [Rhizobium straminoryzae]